MNKSDAIAFADENLKNFAIRKGWHKLVHDMLIEYYEAGWNPAIKVGGKEKFGGLRCYSRSGNAETDQKINAIVRKYARLSGKTCELCGKEAKHRYVGNWEETLCFDHYKACYPTIRISGKTLKVGKRTIEIRKFKKAESLFDFRYIVFYTRTFFFEYKQSVSFSHQQPNFYTLLRTVPRSIFSKEDAQYIDRFFNNLSYCEICGRTAVFENHCYYCIGTPWEAYSSPSLYIDKTDYIKTQQMNNFLDIFDDLKIKQEDRSFEKDPDHQVLFTAEELEEYKRDLSDE